MPFFTLDPKVKHHSSPGWCHELWILMDNIQLVLIHKSVTLFVLLIDKRSMAMVILFAMCLFKNVTVSSIWVSLLTAGWVGRNMWMLFFITLVKSEASYGEIWGHAQGFALTKCMWIQYWIMLLQYGRLIWLSISTSLKVFYVMGLDLLLVTFIRLAVFLFFFRSCNFLD